MCGIAGVWRFNGRTTSQDRADADEMGKALHHRGPDGAGRWSGQRLVLVHRRLSIIDLSENGLQPMVTSDGQGVIAYNGEVYNYLELRRELVAEGVRFRSKTDSEVVLAALHYWGVEKAITRFNGMFALAYHDLRDGTLWLVRDRAGIKALSVMRDGNRLLFASEDKGIFAASGVTATLSARVMTLFLAGQTVNSYLSSFSGIRRLAPGTLWRVAPDGTNEVRYWNALDSIDKMRLAEMPRDIGGERKRLESLVQESVALHVQTDATLATACSSGVDSGLVTTLASAIVNPLDAYVIAPDTGINEADDAQRIADNARVNLRRIPITKEIYLRSLPRTVFHLESGTNKPSCAAMTVMIDCCRADGVKVLLTGEGADELFGGYRWHARSARRHRHTGNQLLRWIAPAVAARYERRLVALPFANMPGPSEINLHELLSTGLLPSSGLVAREILERLSCLRKTSDRLYAGNGLFDFLFHMQDIIHRHDRLAMASSVELRVPFLENRLIDYGFNLHPMLKYRHGQPKWLLKQVAERHIPKPNIHARKKGFPLTDRYLLGTETLIYDGVLSDVMAWSAADIEGVRQIAATNSDVRMRVVSAELLARLYCDGQSVEHLGERLCALAR